METSVGERIRAARKARYWTQQDLAYHSGLSYKTISMAENDGGVKDRTIHTILKTLGLAEEQEVAS